MPQPNPKPQQSSNPPTPGKGFLGWLGRQVGHVSKALKMDVAPTAPKTIYRDTQVEEQALPHDPNVKLRRTVIDEVVVTPPKAVGNGKPPLDSQKKT